MTVPSITIPVSHVFISSKNGGEATGREFHAPTRDDRQVSFRMSVHPELSTCVAEVEVSFENLRSILEAKGYNHFVVKENVYERERDVET